MEIDEILDATADFLEMHEWFGYGSGVTRGLAFCVGMAMGHVCEMGGYVRALPRFLDFVGAECNPTTDPDFTYALVHWNDTVAESKENVIWALRGAAEKERANT